MKRVGYGISSKKQKGYEIIELMKANVDKLC
jgi:biotin operon repressor